MVSFRVLPLDWSGLASLSDDAKALLSIFSLATTDQSILSRCIAASQHPPSGRLEFDLPATLQRIFFLRMWLGKTFEIVESIDSIKRHDLITDDALKPIFSLIHADAESLKNKSAYKIALRLRNDSSFHYGFKSTRKNCVGVDPTANCSMHWGKRTINSYFPMGEEISFGRALSSFMSKPELDGGFSDLLESLTSWGLAGSKWVRDSHTTLVSELLHRDVNSPECVDHSLEDLEPVVKPVDAHIPVFFSDPGMTP